MHMHNTVIFTNYCFVLLQIFADSLSPYLPVIQNSDWSIEEGIWSGKFHHWPMFQGKIIVQNKKKLIETF